MKDWMTFNTKGYCAMDADSINCTMVTVKVGLVIV